MEIKNKIRVGHFIRFFLHPSETFIFNQVEFLNISDEFEPVVFTKIFSKDKLISSIHPLVIGDLLSPVNKKWDDLQYKCCRKLSKSATRAIINNIEALDIKILHFHFLVDARYYLDVIKKTRLPVIISTYGWDVSNFPMKFFGLGQKYLQQIYPYVDLYLAMSNDMKQDLIKIGCNEKNIKIHYHGINVDRFCVPNRDYTKQDNFKILFCGRLTHKKGTLILLNAFNEIINKNLTKLNVELRFVGNGPLRKEMETFVQINKLEQYVKFLGHISHTDEKLVNEYKDADLFILPSLIVKNNRKTRNDKEGIPGTLVEALASGLPVISTYHAGIPEVVSNNVNGLLVKENDYIELSQTIVKLLNDEKLRARIGLAAAESSKKLNVKKKSDDLILLYKELINN